MQTQLTLSRQGGMAESFFFLEYANTCTSGTCVNRSHCVAGLIWTVGPLSLSLPLYSLWGGEGGGGGRMQPPHWSQMTTDRGTLVSTIRQVVMATNEIWQSGRQRLK